MIKILKKMATLAVVFIFILSLMQVVTAAHGNGKAVHFEEHEETEPVRKAIDAVEKISERLKDRVDNDSEDDNGSEKRERAITAARDRLEDVKERVDNARVKYLNAKKRYEEAQEAYQNKKSELAELRKQADDCEDDCEEEKRGLRKGVQQHLIKTIDVMERSLEKLLDRVEDSKVISDEDKENAFTAILDLEVELDLQKTELEELSAEMSPEELRTAIQDLKDTWQDVRKTQRRIVAMLTNSKQENLIEKHHEYINGMELRIEDLAAQGIDVSELQEILEEFREIVAKLEEDHAASKGLLVDFQSGRNLLDEWKEAQRNVQEDLKDSKEILREFLAEYRELRDELKELSGEVESEEAEVKSKVEVDGNVELSPEADALLDELLETFASTEGKIELKLKIEFEDGEIKVEEEVEGTLTSEQLDLWTQLKNMSTTLVEESTEEDAELEIELEHEVEVDEESENETSEDLDEDDSEESEEETEEQEESENETSEEE